MEIPSSRAHAPFDPYDPQHVLESSARFADARATCPVSSPHPGLVVLARQKDVEHALNSPDTFSNHGNFSLYDEPFLPDLPAAITALDAPEHTVLRARLRAFFSPVHIRSLEPMVREIVSDVLAEFRPGQTIDFIAQVARVVPVRVVYTFIGLPVEDWARVQAWLDTISMRLPLVPADLPELVELLDYIAELTTRLAAEPATGVGVIDGLVHESEGQEAFTAEQMQSYVLQLIMAGTDTTGALMSNLVRSLLSGPGLWTRVGAERALIPATIEESLRFTSPLQYTLRTAKKDTVMEGCPVPHGAKVLASLQSANHDESVYGADADEFVMERGQSGSIRHFAFGNGAHVCLGAPLARLEATVLIEEMLERFPAASIDPDFQPNMMPGGFIQMPLNLEVRL